MSSKCGCMSSSAAFINLLSAMVVLLLLQRELVDVDVAGAETLRAAGEVVHVAVVDLFGRNRDGLVPTRLKRLGPRIKSFGIVGLQRLVAGQLETGVGAFLLDSFDRRQAPAGKDLGDDE